MTTTTDKDGDTFVELTEGSGDAGAQWWTQLGEPAEGEPPNCALVAADIRRHIKQRQGRHWRRWRYLFNCGHGAQPVG